ncbi:MAG: hypothetical protein PHT48_07540, partial [Dechloromonas sp.]|nr:hypothetical protein [Dechloromonas sp.]
MTASQPSSVSLRQHLRWRVGLLVSGAILLASVGFFIFVLQPMVSRVAESQFERSAAEVNAELNKV